MELKHWLFLAIVLIVGYVLGRHYPTALPTVAGF